MPGMSATAAAGRDRLHNDWRRRHNHRCRHRVIDVRRKGVAKFTTLFDGHMVES
jgi:hypothetical protein